MKNGAEPADAGLHFSQPPDESRIHTFSHEAMATVFELHLVNEDADYAGQAAKEVFAEVDRLENELSRYVESSDINRLNHAAAGEPISLGIDTFNCIQKAQEIFTLTGGVFDITIGRLFECWLGPDKKLRQPTPQELEEARRLTGIDKVRLDPEWMTVEVPMQGMRFDLGGIGKGYAADKIAELLEEWSIEAALILAGASSVMARGAPPDQEGWAMTFSHPLQPDRTLLRLRARDRALAGSGMQQGRHIIDPRDSSCRPVTGRIAAWSSAPDATTADALSTAFMILTPDEIQKLCSDHPKLKGAVLMENAQNPAGESKLSRWGDWNDLGC